MSTHNETIQKYFATFKAVLDNFPIDDLEKFISVIEDVREKGNVLFTCGNGGSWATATHMAADLSKNTRMPGENRLKVIGLGDNVASLTAYANDEGYERVFAEPLLTLMKPDDVLLAISGSGNSPNVLRAVETAKEIGATTLGLTGFYGGELGEMVDHALIVPSDSMEMIEDFHMMVDHVMVICLRH